MLLRTELQWYTIPKVMPYYVLINTTIIQDLSTVQTNKIYHRTGPMSVSRRRIIWVLLETVTTTKTGRSINSIYRIQMSTYLKKLSTE